MEEDGFQLVLSRRRRKAGGNYIVNRPISKCWSNRWTHDSVVNNDGLHGGHQEWTSADDVDRGLSLRIHKKIERMSADWRAGDYTTIILPCLRKALRRGRPESSATNMLGAVCSIVCYGLGNFSHSHCSASQLALLLCLKDDVLLDDDGRVYLYDPAFTATEKSVLVDHFGLRLVDEDERCGRRVDEPTCFLMPHLDTIFYDNLLAANTNLTATVDDVRHPDGLFNVVLIGNSLSDAAASIVYPRGEFEKTFPNIAKCLHIVDEQPLRMDRAFEKGFSNTSIHTFQRRSDSFNS